MAIESPAMQRTPAPDQILLEPPKSAADAGYSTTAASRSWRCLLLVPIVAAIGYSAYWSGYSIYFRLILPWPLHPWESAILCDAFRVADGERGVCQGAH